MGTEPVEILKFVLFGFVWLLPFGFMVAVLSFSAADAKAQREDPGPNVVPFPTRPPAAKPSRLDRLKRLAFPRAKG